jgi:hypothetical protein
MKKIFFSLLFFCNNTLSVKPCIVSV